MTAAARAALPPPSDSPSEEPEVSESEEYEEPEEVMDCLANDAVVLAGRFGAPRTHMVYRVERLGGSVKASVSKKVTLVVSTQEAVDAMSGAVKKAFDLGIPVVSVDFLGQTDNDGVRADPAEFSLSPAGADGAGNGGASAVDGDGKRGAPASAAARKRQKVSAPKPTPEKPLSGAVFAIFGDLQTPRRTLVKRIKEMGGVVRPSVKPDVNVIMASFSSIADPEPVVEASDRGVPVVSDTFLDDAADEGDWRKALKVHGSLLDDQEDERGTRKDAEEDSEEKKEEEDEEEEEEEEGSESEPEMLVRKEKGGAVLDEGLPNSLTNTCHVLADPDSPGSFYDATLNFTEYVV